MSWRWLPTAQRYYNDDTKRFMSRQAVLTNIGASISNTSNATDTLAELVADGRLSPNDWQSQMQQQIKEEYIRQYIFGRGGRDQMTFADWGAIGGMLSEQSPFLNNFRIDIEMGDLTEAKIAQISQMYISSAREAYERANEVAAGIPRATLPQYPGDGHTICLTNDQCHWNIVTIRDDEGNIIRWECFWVLSPEAKHCETCLVNANTWNPFIIEA